jgi:MFS transporter, ACS family, tartrate transporter
MKADSAIANRTVARVARRILPFLLLLYVVAFVDRVNVAYAALEMTQDLGFSDQIFGFGAGVFFLGYVLLAIPGALAVERWSARMLISGLLVCWGLVTTLTSLVHTPAQFYILRLLLGAAEAGFFPGVIVYLSHWFPARDRAKAVAGFLIGIPIASIVGSPLAGLILRVHWLEFDGWRWLFILEGVPAILLAVVTYFYLTDRPQDARWLTKDEREWLVDTLIEESKTKRVSAPSSIARVFLDPRVIMLGGVYLLGDVGLYGFTIWFPTILKRVSGFSTLTVTLVAVFPYLVALLSDLAVGWHSDKTGERRWHTALPLFAGTVILFFGLAFNLALPIQIILFCALTGCLHCWQPSFWSLPTALLGESAAAASVGFINSVGHVGAFTGPFLIGYLRTHYHSFAPGLAVLLISLLSAGVLVLLIETPLRPRVAEISEHEFVT